MHIGNFHRMGYVILHHLAGATIIHVANLVNSSRGWQIYVSSYFSLVAASRTQWQCLGDLDYGLVKV